MHAAGHGVRRVGAIDAARVSAREVVRVGLGNARGRHWTPRAGDGQVARVARVWPPVGSGERVLVNWHQSRARNGGAGGIVHGNDASDGLLARVSGHEIRHRASRDAIRVVHVVHSGPGISLHRRLEEKAARRLLAGHANMDMHTARVRRGGAILTGRIGADEVVLHLRDARLPNLHEGSARNSLRDATAMRFRLIQSEKQTFTTTKEFQT
mmetsp:Transcript_9287/g.20345  ORF Transcript_9287/g.20345 Transcript_9287/m.20345 type:complete len:211 (+) Transcript_9287:1047-1679(+)